MKRATNNPLWTTAATAIDVWPRTTDPRQVVGGQSVQNAMSAVDIREAELDRKEHTRATDAGRVVKRRSASVFALRKSRNGIIARVEPDVTACCMLEEQPEMDVYPNEPVAPLQ